MKKRQQTALLEVYLYLSIAILVFLLSCSQNTSKEQAPTNEKEAIILAVNPSSYLISTKKIAMLINLVEAEGLSSNTETSLVAKLNAAIDANNNLENKLDNNPNYCNSKRTRIICVNLGNRIKSNLRAFIAQVEDLSTTRTTRRGRVIPAVIDKAAAKKFISAAKACLNNQTVIYVDKDANGTNDITSWENAFNNLQDGLAAWVSFAHPDGIWLANGVYYPDEGEDVTDNDGEASFNLKPEMKLYGRFAGGEANLNDRDVDANLTVLSGDIDDNDYKDGNGITPTADDINGNNSAHVVFTDGTTGTPITDSTILDGFTITGGRANNEDSLPFLGGGMFYNGARANNECSPTLTNVSFSRNHANIQGGAMKNLTSNPIIQNTIFWGNTINNPNFGSSREISNRFGSTPVISHSLFEGSLPAGSTNGGNNIENASDPFEDAANGDLQPTNCSDAIDAGDNNVNSESTDLAGNDRNVDDANVVDIGKVMELHLLLIWELTRNNLIAVGVFHREHRTHTLRQITLYDVINFESRADYETTNSTKKSYS